MTNEILSTRLKAELLVDCAHGVLVKIDTCEPMSIQNIMQETISHDVPW